MRKRDFFVVLVCLSISAYGAYLFYNSFTKTLAVIIEPAGRENAECSFVQNEDSLVIQAQELRLISPVMNSLFRNRAGMPDIRFQWSQVENTAYYVLEIAQTRNFINPRIKQVMGTSFVVPDLAPGNWFWRVRPVFPNYQENRGFAQIGNFRIEQNTELTTPVLISPANHAFLDIGPNRNDIVFSWRRLGEDGAYTIRIFNDITMQNLVVSKTVRDNFFLFKRDKTFLDTGYYFWNVFFTSGGGESSSVSHTRLFTAMDFLQQEIIAEPQSAAGQVPYRVFMPLSLETPANGEALPGLAALREQTIFRWNSSETVGSSRFVLSRNNTLLEAPEVEILNPDKTFSLSKLKEGTWYWTIKAVTPEGADISALSVNKLQVLPIALLPAADNMRPINGYRIGSSQLRNLSHLNFTWSPVNGANAYIFALYNLTSQGRRQIVYTDTITRTNWILDNFNLLRRGSFIWQVEAVYINQNGIIEQQGQVGENSFVVDIYSH